MRSRCGFRGASFGAGQVHQEKLPALGLHRRLDLTRHRLHFRKRPGSVVDRDKHVVLDRRCVFECSAVVLSTNDFRSRPREATMDRSARVQTRRLLASVAGRDYLAIWSDHASFAVSSLGFDDVAFGHVVGGVQTSL
jgi:hypothetical protein